jgi:anti-anti-sigma factor
MLRRALLDPQRCPGPRVIVDLCPVSFLDSSSLGALVAARARLLEVGGGISVRCHEGVVHRVLEMAGLLEMLDVVIERAD